jgi:RNA polymerase sigma factor (sigma-70 family)
VKLSNLVLLQPTTLENTLLRLPYETFDETTEKRLAEDWLTNRNIASRDKLMFSCTASVRALARSYARGNNQKFKDLVQEGHLGLLRAVDKFDPERDTRFLTYAIWWVRSFMLNFLRGLPPPELSLDSPLQENEKTTFKDTLSDPLNSIESVLGLNSPDDIPLLKQAVASLLHEKQRMLINLRFFSGNGVAPIEDIQKAMPDDNGQPIAIPKLLRIERKAIKTLRLILQTLHERNDPEQSSASK